MSETQPFKRLGQSLKTIRQRNHETLAEVSGAVEIDEQELRLIEQGDARPSEDILLLLINHFDMPDEDADKLWTLAGYEPRHDDQDDRQQQEGQNGRTMVMIMAVDPRVIYSDGVHITANNSGVVINFSQGAGTPNAITTSRIGMSREQARGLMETLHRALEGTKPRQLPSGHKPKQQDGTQKPEQPKD